MEELAAQVQRACLTADPAVVAEQVRRMEEEGPHPVYDSLVRQYGIDPARRAFEPWG